MSRVFHGSCLCGSVAFELHGPTEMGLCECVRCRRWSGASGATLVIVPRQGFTLSRGQEALMTYHDDKGPVDRSFCSRCGSSLFEDDGESLYVGAGVLTEEPNLPVAWEYDRLGVRVSSAGEGSGA